SIQRRYEQKQPAFDLVCMDIQMPVMSGIDTTRAIRSLESTFENHNRLPIIALTAHALSDEKHKLLQNGMDDYVTKPIQIEQIVQILTQWTTESSKKPPVPERINVIEALDRNILYGQQSRQRAANKWELPMDVRGMVVDSFENELTEIEQLIELEDFPQLEHVLHRLYGAARYVGTPSLQTITGEFEQFVSTLRKERRKADESFVQQVLKYLDELKTVIEQVEQAARQILYKSDH